MDACQFGGSDNPSSSLLEFFELCQRCGEFFVGFSHAGLIWTLAGLRVVNVLVYNDVQSQVNDVVRLHVYDVVQLIVFCANRHV